ncbi:hypothetical protein TNCV_562551 [Trichonephila clavipes]|nr:hypothetical protein TNCV_562551 [Trichonephila clavipes]
MAMFAENDQTKRKFLGLNIWIGRLKIRQRLTFSVPSFASLTDTAVSVHKTALFGKVTKTPKIQFQIASPRFETHEELNFNAPVHANSAAKENENSQAGLERKAILLNSGNTLQVYGSF